MPGTGGGRGRRYYARGSGGAGLFSSWKMREPSHWADPFGNALVGHITRAGAGRTWENRWLWAHKLPRFGVFDAPGRDRDAASGELNVGQWSGAEAGHLATAPGLIGFTTYHGTGHGASDWEGGPAERKVKCGAAGARRPAFRGVAARRGGKTKGVPAPRRRIRILAQAAVLGSAGLGGGGRFGGDLTGPKPEASRAIISVPGWSPNQVPR